MTGREESKHRGRWRSVPGDAHGPSAPASRSGSPLRSGGPCWAAARLRAHTRLTRFGRGEAVGSQSSVRVRPKEMAFRTISEVLELKMLEGLNLNYPAMYPILLVFRIPRETDLHLSSQTRISVFHAPASAGERLPSGLRPSSRAPRRRLLR